jgi:fructose-1-phosphate kinase PfkB-like protein
MFQDNLQAGKFLEDLSGFGLEFTRALKLFEEESWIEKLAQQKPRKFEESENSQKSIKSTIVSDKKDAKKEIKSKKEQKKSEENIQETTQSVNDLDEQTIMENFRKLSQKMKSP